MVTILIIIHVLICLGLILGILLQAGKGADLGAAFGGSSQTIFGSAGAAPFLSKVTTAIAIGFMITSLSLAFIRSRPSKSLLIEGKAKSRQEAPFKTDVQKDAQQTNKGNPSDTKTE
ncbi:MAG TPA: preprotein translocase subunit SecG [Desulfatiglandales bacterium]|nr:preprotein translocase subunit SecG [Desulfatiglandales bacterium]